MIDTDTQLRGHLLQSVSVASSTAVNNSGERTFGSATARLARVIGRQRLVKNADGQQALSDKQLILSSTYEPKTTDVFWLPGQSTAEEPWRPSAVSVRYDEQGNVDHYKVFLGASRSR